jgi:hypothetical protein
VPPRLVADASGVIAVACRGVDLPSAQNPAPANRDAWSNGWILDLKNSRAYPFDPDKPEIVPTTGGDIVDVGEDFVTFCEGHACDSANTLLNRINGRLQVMKLIEGHGFFAGTDGFECKAVPKPPGFQTGAK